MQFIREPDQFGLNDGGIFDGSTENFQLVKIYVPDLLAAINVKRMLPVFPNSAVRHNRYRNIASRKLGKKGISLLLVRYDIQVSRNTAAFFRRLILGDRIGAYVNTCRIPGFCI